MRLSRVRMQNFRQHKLSTVEFDSGLTGIIGPNGAGKSTILEAIAWALYGNPAARGMRDVEVDVYLKKVTLRGDPQAAEVARSVYGVESVRVE